MRNSALTVFFTGAVFLLSSCAEPVEQGDAEPVEQGDAEPVEQGDAEPVEQGDAEPVEQGDAEPVEQDDAEPVEQGDAEPVEQGDAEPVEQGDAEPVEQGDAEPVEQGDAELVEQGEDAFNFEALDDPCVGDGANAVYLKVDGGWRLRPCDECESISVEAYWGGNTGGHLEIVKVLEEMSVDLPNQEISLLQYAQHTGECP